MTQIERPQLQMVWPTLRVGRPPEVRPLPGYAIRTFRDGDEARFYEIMALAGWPGWDADRLRFSLSRVLPSGWFLATREDTGQVVASAMCLHNYTERYPFRGDLGWLACDPAHTGHGLGYVLSAVVTARFLSAGYTHIGLGTEYFRLPAIKTYLNVGYVPLLTGTETQELWKDVCRQLEWPFTPEVWLAND